MADRDAGPPAGPEAARLTFTADRRLWRAVGLAAALGLGLGLGLALLAHLLRARPPTALLIGLPTLIAVLLQLVRASFNEMVPVEERPVRASVSTSEYFLKLRQLERRLQGASADATKFEWNLRPVLVELIADRLRYQHRTSIQREPERARAIIGEQLWLIVDRPPDGQQLLLSRTQLTAVVAAIEAI